MTCTMALVSIVNLNLNHFHPGHIRSSEANVKWLFTSWHLPCDVKRCTVWWLIRLFLFSLCYCTFLLSMSRLTRQKVHEEEEEEEKQERIGQEAWTPEFHSALCLSCLPYPTPPSVSLLLGAFTPWTQWPWLRNRPSMCACVCVYVCVCVSFLLSSVSVRVSVCL